MEDTIIKPVKRGRPKEKTVYINGKPCKGRLVEVGPDDNEEVAYCRHCGCEKGRFIQDVIQHGFFEDDVVSVWKCKQRHYTIYHARISRIEETK